MNFRIVPFATASRINKYGGCREVAAGIALTDTPLGSGIAMLSNNMVREDVRVFEASVDLLFWRLRVGVQVRSNPRKE